MDELPHNGVPATIVQADSTCYSERRFARSAHGDRGGFDHSRRPGRSRAPGRFTVPRSIASANRKACRRPQDHCRQCDAPPNPNIEASQPPVHLVDNDRKCANSPRKRGSLLTRHLLAARTAHSAIPLIDPEIQSCLTGPPPISMRRRRRSRSLRIKIPLELVSADRIRLPRLHSRKPAARLPRSE